jgi:DNA-binding transcriptional LysR family regulator
MADDNGRRVPLIQLDLLQTMVAIADSGNFSAAALAVLRTPSAVSMQVRRLEDMLGTALFRRDSRTVMLTPEGEQVVQHARRMLALNRETVARFIRPEFEGLVRIGAPNDDAETYLPDVLRRMAATHPGIAIEVLVDVSPRLRTALDEGRLDIGVVGRHAESAAEHAGDCLFSERLVWAMAEAGIAVERDPLPLAVWEERCPWRRACEDGLRAQGRAWRIAAISAHPTGQRAAALADLAVTPLPLSMLRRGLVEVPADYGLPALPDDYLTLIVRSAAPPAVRAAADHLRRSFARLQESA